MKNRKAQLPLINFIVLIIFVVVMFVSGILAGIIYYQMELLENNLELVNFEIPIEDNSTINSFNITDFQDILGVTVYQLLGLRSTLPYLTYFMIFGFIIALGILAYVSSRNGIFFVIHILITIVMTYFCLEISNKYMELLENPFINQIMTDFIIYNKLMIYLPSVVFFTGLVFGAIAFINLMKPQSNLIGNQQSINYGGEY